MLLLAMLTSVAACRSKGEKGEPGADPSASAGLAPIAPIALTDLPSVVTHPNCVRDETAKVSPELESTLAALPSPLHPKARHRFGFRCLTKPAVLLALDYGDEGLAKRALLHYAHLFLLPADHTAPYPLPVGGLVRRGAVVAIVVGEGNAITVALLERGGFVAAVAGYPAGGRGGAGSALPFVSMPGAFTAARQARDYAYGCNEKLPATLHACADLDVYERAKGEHPPWKKPEAYVGACVAKPPLGRPLTEEACWLLWSPFGVEVGTVKELGVSLVGVSLDALREKGAAALPRPKAAELADAILERGPGRRAEYVDSSERALSADGKESLSLRADPKSFVVVRATNDRVKAPLLVAGFARAGALGL